MKNFFSVQEVCFASDWEYDLDFLAILEERLRGWGHSVLRVWPGDLAETLAALRRGSLSFRFLVDRASNTSPEFLELYEHLAATGIRTLDDPRTMIWASDKATMHLEFITGGIQVPHTLIVAPFDTAEDIALTREELARLKGPFFIKPANTTGGGVGVFEGATTLEEILTVRRQYKGDKYLVQERIVPLEKDGRRFWFRAFHVCGQVFLTWWNELTHVYETLQQPEIERYGLESLPCIVKAIARVCRLNFFSTEIVLDPSGRLVAVDYVNESCDLRLQSRHNDGIPDEVVRGIAAVIADFIGRELS